MKCPPLLLNPEHIWYATGITNRFKCQKCDAEIQIIHDSIIYPK